MLEPLHRCNYNHNSRCFIKYINVSYCDRSVLVLVGWCTQKFQLVVHHPREVDVLRIVK
jgi:hypothetical protein